MRGKLDESDDGYVLIVSAYHPVACAKKVDAVPEQKEGGVRPRKRTITEVSTAPTWELEHVTKQADGIKSLYVTHKGQIFAEIKGLVVPWKASPLNQQLS